MKKNTKNTFSRSFSILAAAALSMTLIGGQTFPAYAENSSGIESGAVIPDNITIDSPTALANIALPSNAYGTLSWADSSYVPDKRVQSCGVVFKPAAGADLSGLPGYCWQLPRRFRKPRQMLLLLLQKQDSYPHCFPRNNRLDTDKM